MNPLRTRLIAVGVIAQQLLWVGCSDHNSTNGYDAYRGADYSPAWSPDGDAVAFFSEDIKDSLEDPADGWLRSIELSTRVVSDIWHIPEGLAVWGLTWSPDSRWLIFSSDVGLYKILSTGDSLQQLTSGEFQNYPCWSKVSNTIYFFQGTNPTGGIFAVAPDGTGRVRLVPSDSDVASICCFLGAESLLVARYVDGTKECLMPLSTVSGGFGEKEVCDLRLVKTMRIASDGDLIVFLGLTLSRNVLSIYCLSRTDGVVRRVADGYDFDLGPDDCTLVIADLAAPRGLRLYNLYTKYQTRLTRVPFAMDN